jgi:hypothetical protein
MVVIIFIVVGRASLTLQQLNLVMENHRSMLLLIFPCVLEIYSAARHILKTNTTPKYGVGA